MGIVRGKISKQHIAYLKFLFHEYIILDFIILYMNHIFFGDKTKLKVNGIKTKNVVPLKTKVY